MMSWFGGKGGDEKRLDKLMLAIEENDLVSIEKVVQKRPQLAQLRNAYGMSPLMYATLRGLHEIVGYFLEIGADPHEISQDGRTPLMVAVLEGDMSMLSLFLSAGAHVNVADRFGGSPLMYAVQVEKEEMVHALIERGADVNVRAIEGATVLM